MIYLFQLVNGIGLGMLYFLLAAGLSIIFGLLHFVNFAHGAFYLLGAYFVYDMTERGLNFWAVSDIGGDELTEFVDKFEAAMKANVEG